MIENEFVSRHRLIDNEPEEMFTNPTDPFHFILFSASEIDFSQIRNSLLDPAECRTISLIVLFIYLVKFIWLTLFPSTTRADIFRAMINLWNFFTHKKKALDVDRRIGSNHRESNQRDNNQSKSANFGSRQSLI